jgi:hypothetical protein
LGEVAENAEGNGSIEMGMQLCLWKGFDERELGFCE